MHRLGEELGDGEEGAELGGGRPAVRVGADLIGGVRQIARAWISSVERSVAKSGRSRGPGSRDLEESSTLHRQPRIAAASQ